MDKQLIEKLASGELTDEEFRQLLARSHDNVDKLRKQREANRLRSLQLLEEKRSKRTQKDEFDFDEETAQKLDKVEQRVTNKLIKHKDEISERDMKNLLSEARRQQDEILRQRNIERLRQNENMKKKLAERRAKMQQTESEGGANMLTDLEDEFYNELKRKLASGDLTHEQFKALIDEHLSRMSGAAGHTIAGQQKKNQREASEPKEDHAIKAAQSIIKRSAQKSKAIQDVRQMERQNALAELKQKKKKNRAKTTD